MTTTTPGTEGQGAAALGRFVEDMKAAEYHADPCRVPSLSSSLAKVVVTRSMRHAWLRHPKMGGRQIEPTEDMDTGSLAHAIMLGEGREIVAVDAKDWRTNVAKEAREAARAEGKNPVLARKLDDARFLVDSLQANLSDMGIVLNGASELVVLWSEDTASGECSCRGMLDHWIESEAHIYDLKFTDDANPEYLPSHVVSMGYDIQGAAYTSAVEAAAPWLTGRVRFTRLFCELETGVIVPDEQRGAMAELGRSRWARACERWARALRDRSFPGYVTAPTTIEPTTFALEREQTARMGAGWGEQWKALEATL